MKKVKFSIKGVGFHGFSAVNNRVLQNKHTNQKLKMAKKTKRSLKNIARLQKQQKLELKAEQCRRDQQRQRSEKKRFQQFKSVEVEAKPCSRQCEPDRSDVSLKPNVIDFVSLGAYLYNEFKRKLGEQLESFRQISFSELSFNALFEPNVKDFLAMGANLYEHEFQRKLGEQSESFRRKVFAELWKQKAFREMVEKEEEEKRLNQQREMLVVTVIYMNGVCSVRKLSNVYRTNQYN